MRPFFLFPGLACTERLFAPQKDAWSDWVEVIVPPWVEPCREETLDAFARRWAEAVWETYFVSGKYPREEGCYVGGLSFGGMIAPIVGEFLMARGVRVKYAFRISTVRCGDEIPPFHRILWRLLHFFPGGGWYPAKIFCWLVLQLFPRQISFARREVYQQVLDTPVERCRQVVRMLSAWHSPLQEYPFPFFQIHGEDDSLLPLKYTSPDVVLKRAGHCLTLTRSEEVNQLIGTILQTVEETSSRHSFN